MKSLLPQKPCATPLDWHSWCPLRLVQLRRQSHPVSGGSEFSKRWAGKKKIKNKLWLTSWIRRRTAALWSPGLSVWGGRHSTLGLFPDCATSKPIHKLSLLDSRCSVNGPMLWRQGIWGRIRPFSEPWIHSHFATCCMHYFIPSLRLHGPPSLQAGNTYLENVLLSNSLNNFSIIDA